MLLREKLTWADVCADPNLRDLPFKIELNRLNQIVMSPAHPRHSRLQSKVARILGDLLTEGEAIVELAIETEDSTKVPDVVWTSKSMIDRHSSDPSWVNAPEICVEVISPHNTRSEMLEKKGLYFAAGAEEVWFCHRDGRMEFFRKTVAEASAGSLCPDFPQRIASSDAP